MHHINWQIPYTLLYGEMPSVEHLRVFGCGAYIFLPAEVRANKLTPKSELMTYLGNAPGAGGFMFMRSPNNVLFYSTHCIFDEVLLSGLCENYAVVTLFFLNFPYLLQDLLS